MTQTGEHGLALTEQLHALELQNTQLRLLVAELLKTNEELRHFHFTAVPQAAAFAS